MGFPAQHRAKIHSTNPIERLDGEIKRRSDDQIDLVRGSFQQILPPLSLIESNPLLHHAGFHEVVTGLTKIFC